MFLFVKLRMQSLKLFIRYKNTKRLCLGRVNGESLFGVILRAFFGDPEWKSRPVPPTVPVAGQPSSSHVCMPPAWPQPVASSLQGSAGGWQVRKAPALAVSHRSRSIPFSHSAGSWHPSVKARWRWQNPAWGCWRFSFFFLLGVEPSDQSFKRQKVFQRDRLTVKSWGPFCRFVSSESHRFAGQLLLLSDLHDWLPLLWGETHLLKKPLLNRYSS